MFSARVFWAVVIAVSLLRWGSFRKVQNAHQIACERQQSHFWTGEGDLLPLSRDDGLLVGARSYPIRVKTERAPEYQRVRFTGRVKCLNPARNPARLQDSWRALGGPLAFGRGKLTAVGPASWRVRSRGALHRKIESLPGAGMRALSLSVWLGYTQGLGVVWMDLYRTTGVLHLVALSGQHVATLWMLLRSMLWFVALFGSRYAFCRRYITLSIAWLPFGCAVVLWWINPGNDSVFRALLVVLCARVLKLRALNAQLLPIVAGAVAVGVMSVPTQAASISYWLSGAGTLFLVLQLDAMKKHSALRQYLILSLLMPLWMFPSSVFFFGRLTLAAPLAGLALGGLWSLVLIPLGFVFPWIGPWLPGDAVRLFEKAWNGLESGQVGLASWLTHSAPAVYRPTWVETAALNALLFLLLFRRRKEA